MQRRLTIRGRLEPNIFVPWIRRYATKLGLDHAVLAAGTERIELDLRGADELIDMMNVGCLLGPIEAEVDSVVATPDAGASD